MGLLGGREEGLCSFCTAAVHECARSPLGGTLTSSITANCFERTSVAEGLSLLIPTHGIKKKCAWEEEKKKKEKGQFVHAGCLMLQQFEYWHSCMETNRTNSPTFVVGLASLEYCRKKEINWHWSSGFFLVHCATKSKNLSWTFKLAKQTKKKKSKSIWDYLAIGEKF